VASLEAGNAQDDAGAGLGGFLLLIAEFDAHILTAGASHVEFAFIFRVEVDEDIALKHACFEAVGTVHARFFGGREETFEGPVRDIGGCQECHGGGHADAVIGAQGGAVGAHPFPVDDRLNGILLKVVGFVVVFLGNHVKVPLKDHPFAVFHTGSGRLADDDVARGIADRFQTQRLAEILHVVADFLLVVRGTGNLRQLVEVIPHLLRFQFHYFFTHN